MVSGDDETVAARLLPFCFGQSNGGGVPHPDWLRAPALGVSRL